MAGTRCHASSAGHWEDASTEAAEVKSCLSGSRRRHRRCDGDPGVQAIERERGRPRVKVPLPRACHEVVSFYSVYIEVLELYPSLGRIELIFPGT